MHSRVVALLTVTSIGWAGLARAAESHPEVATPPVHFYLGPGVLMSDSGPGLSAEIGLELYGALVRASGSATIIGKRAFRSKSAMAGFALGMGDFAPYAGMGLGTVSWTPHREFFEPQFNVNADATVVSPEVGVILGHRRSFMRMLVSVQLMIPLSPRFSSAASIPATFSRDTAPWFVGAVRISL